MSRYERHSETLEQGESASPTLGIILGWGAFWFLMIAVAVREHASHSEQLWEPVILEGSSMLVATTLLALRWKHVMRMDAYISAPWSWIWRSVLPLPLFALFFVGAVYGLRHAVYGLLGREYLHGPWVDVWVMESLRFGMFYLLFLGFVFGLRSHAVLLDERLRLQKVETLAREAQLLQLARQIEPHFLFNALNMIASLVHENPDRADALLVRLSSLLRSATDLTASAESTLEVELDLARAYSELMCARFEDRVFVHFDVDRAALNCKVPTLSLQPVLENAFRHGVERNSGKVNITVTAERVSGALLLKVSDDAGVLSEEPVPGVGLSNVRQRLAALYGNEARLAFMSRAGGGVTVTMELPCVC